jgi:hypothetical protein
MSSAPATPLRQRMIEDMSIRQFGEQTQHGYVAVVADFARFLGRSPVQAQPGMNAAVSALRFFFKVTHLKVGDIDSVRMLVRVEQGSVVGPQMVGLTPCALVAGLSIWERQGEDVAAQVEAPLAAIPLRRRSPFESETIDHAVARKPFGDAVPGAFECPPAARDDIPGDSGDNNIPDAPGGYKARPL